MGGSQENLEALATALSALHDTLSRQTEALERNDTDALPELTQAQQLKAAEVERCWSALIDRLGLPQPLSRRQVEEALPIRTDSRLSDLWASILAMAEAAERVNRLNGKLIAQQLRRTQGALQVLHGAASQRTLYGSDGRVLDLFSPNRSIDEA